MTRKAQMWNMSSIISSNCNSNNRYPPKFLNNTLLGAIFFPPSFQRDKQQRAGKVLLTFVANNNHSPVSRYGGSATFSTAELKISQAWKSFIKQLMKNSHINLIFQHFKFTKMQPGGQMRTGGGETFWNADWRIMGHTFQKQLRKTSVFSLLGVSEIMRFVFVRLQPA